MTIEQPLALLFSGIFGALGILFGAFGAHILKNKMSPELLQSFETGVKYQMYHAISLLVLAFIPLSIISSWPVKLIITGVILFSFSIYGLTLSAAFYKKMKFLGPITPLGGLCLAGAWVMVIYTYFNV